MDDKSSEMREDKKTRITRREFLVTASIAAAGAALAACGQQPAPTQAPAVQPTSAPPPPTAASAATATTAAVTSNTPKDKIVGAFGLDIDDLDPQYFKSIPG